MLWQILEFHVIGFFEDYKAMEPVKSRSERTVVIAMDGSAHSEYAFQCKYEKKPQTPSSSALNLPSCVIRKANLI